MVSHMEGSECTTTLSSYTDSQTLSCFCLSVLHRPVDHPLGRVDPSHPVLRLHRQGKNVQMNIHMY